MNPRTILVTFFVISVFHQALIAQNTNTTFKILEGYWEGAFIKNNSSQKFEINFFKNKDQMMSFQIIEEWHPQFGEFEIPIEIDSLHNISFNTGYGKANLNLDRNALELNGNIENTSTPIYLHLKKAPKPPPKNYTTVAKTIENDGVILTGHMHIPKLATNTAMIIIGGRGCYAGSTKYDLYAKLLRSYGITVLVYNKRGTGKSTGNCEMATISDLASDVVAWKRFLENEYQQFTNIGILGSSAGGWVMTKAQEDGANFDFMIGIVAPSTSVKEQQLQSMQYGANFYKLNENAKEHLKAYTNLMLEAKATQKNFERFKELLNYSQAEGWRELLDDTDIPKSKDDINNLWVRRHDYDPESALHNFNKPLLAIYGEIDWIVPFKENVDVLHKIYKNEKRKLLKTIIAYDAEHGTETEEKLVTLTNKISYWRFYRIAPIVQISIIDFLYDNQFIKRDD
ncbi:MAG: alpha/beta hydrolase [Winogradskyella sp.]|uniref:alpha/beta hydrolase family protein n=1 Tax=Winogradskyella sp. TaxID=1883156 RepID=UPI0025DE3D43|nr:alpha/beta hydrolase [Winogradskyella sp.]NRB59270.1 alpha/beta hydrolase [Winogradskyella sp.]